MTSSHEAISAKPPCVFVPWVAPIACPKHALTQLCVLDLHLPPSLLCAEIPLFSHPLHPLHLFHPFPPLPLDAENVRQYLQQMQAISEDPHALSANMFTHFVPSQRSMSRAEQRDLEHFAEAKSITKVQNVVPASNSRYEIAHQALICAALAQSQQLEMAALIEKYHATLEQFTTSLHGEVPEKVYEEMHGKAPEEVHGKMPKEVECEAQKAEDTHPLHKALRVFDTKPEPIQWPSILDRIALFVPENTIFVLDTRVMQDLPDVLLQPLAPAYFERLPSEWSSFQSTIRGALCTLRHVLDTATKTVCSAKELDREYVFILYPLTQD